jgi:hypothetical protein
VNERILKAISSRYDLTADENDELRQQARLDSSLDSLVASGERFRQRRAFVAEWLTAHPTSTETQAEARFDRVAPSRPAPDGGRRFIAELLSQSTDHRTSKFFSSVGGRTRHSDESKADRTARINERLAAAGYNVQDSYGFDDQERRP